MKRPNQQHRQLLNRLEHQAGLAYLISSRPHRDPSITDRAQDLGDWFLNLFNAAKKRPTFPVPDWAREQLATGNWQLATDH